VNGIFDRINKINKINKMTDELHRRVSAHRDPLARDESHLVNLVNPVKKPFSRRAFLVGAGVALGLPGCIGKPKGGARGDVLRVPISVEPSSLDPVTITDPATLGLLQDIYEGLVRFDTANQIVPCLAERWDVSADGMEYTFHIRPGVKFHNGRAMTAADVKWSFERSLWPETKSPVAASYLAGIMGVDEVAAGKTRELAGVEMVDPQTVRIRLKGPRGYFLGELAYNTGWIYCREAIEKAGGRIDDSSSVGTGPYRLASYAHGSKVTLERFDGYWGGRPRLSRIERPIVIDSQTAHVKFENGEIDLTDISINDYLTDAKNLALKDQRHLNPLLAVSYLAMGQQAQPAFRDVRVRQAFAHAIDRDQISSVAYRGLFPRADAFLPPGLPGHDPSLPHIPYDPGAAKRLLADAGFPEGRGFPSLVVV
jgi:oligopeptide transport system substrate-binding protein